MISPTTVHFDLLKQWQDGGPDPLVNNLLPTFSTNSTEMTVKVTRRLGGVLRFEVRGRGVELVLFEKLVSHR